MDKYKELIKDIAEIIADQGRENFLLKHELEKTKAQLFAAESKLARIDRPVTCGGCESDGDCHA